MNFLRNTFAFASLAVASTVTVPPATAAEPEIGTGFFARLDTNGDGAIDTSEIFAARAARFKQLDENGDGVISEIEQMRAQDRVLRRAAAREALMARQFKRMDANGDQAVTADEFEDMPRIAARLDANSDGRITQEEFTAGVGSVRAREARTKPNQ